MHSNGNEWILGRTKKTQWAPVKLWQKVKYTLGCSDQQRPKSVRSTNIIQDHLDISFPKLRRLARPSGNFPNHKKLTRSTRNFLNSTESFRPCGDFLNSPETLRCNFKVTRQNFPVVQNFTVCIANLVFGSLAISSGWATGSVWVWDHEPTSTQGGPGAQILRHTLHKFYRCPSLGKVFNPKFNLLKLSIAK